MLPGLLTRSPRTPSTGAVIQKSAAEMICPAPPITFQRSNGASAHTSRNTSCVGSAFMHRGSASPSTSRIRVSAEGTTLSREKIVPGVPHVPRTMGALSRAATAPRHTLEFDARANWTLEPALISRSDELNTIGIWNGGLRTGCVLGHNAALPIYSATAYMGICW